MEYAAGMFSTLGRVYDGIRRLPLVARRRIMERDALHDFWRAPAPEGNVPADYIDPALLPRSRALYDLISDLSREARILEVGCNAGRNLAFLYDHGFRNVEGVEISPHAVSLLRSRYPQLSECPIHLGAAESVLPRIPADSFDLIFTMAVLEHIHPDSSDLFLHIARIAPRVLAIEPAEGHSSSRQYPHRLERRFERHGLKLVSIHPMSGDLRNYSAFRFQRSGIMEAEAIAGMTC